MENLKKEIEQLKKERNAVLLAHYYVDDAVQEIADYVGDSYYLAKVALKESKDVICFAGVNFMGESAKILNPDRTVIMPDQKADCPMAHMVDVEKIEEMRKKYDDLAVVCYINSTAEIKVSNNVFKIILPNTNAQAELREELQYHTHIQPEDEETQIMQMIDQEKRIQRKQVQERLGISQTTSGRILKQMVKKGLIMQRGRGKNTCYVKK